MVRVFAVGAGMVPFSRPKSGRGYRQMASGAARAALADAKVDYKDVGACVCSYNYAAPTAGQAAVYELGLTGVPIFNTNNNCSAGSAGICLARTLVMSGQYDVVLCVGFEEMGGGLVEPFADKASPVSRQFEHMYGTLGIEKGTLHPGMTNFTADIIKLFAAAGLEYCKEHGVSEGIFAEIAAKNRLQGQFNENAMLGSKKVPTAEQILAQPKLFGSLTAGMAAGTGDGAAAIVLCSERWVQRHGAHGWAVEILGLSMASDMPSSFNGSAATLAGTDMARRAAEDAYSQAGIVPAEIGVVELHDCFSPNELLMYEALKLAPAGEAAQFFRQQRVVQNSTGTSHVRLGPSGVVVNPSGGLVTKGHPIGATGIGQAVELISQLRGSAGRRQMEPAPRIGVQHNFGFNGGAVVAVWGAPMQRPRKLTAPEIQSIQKFCAGWGNGGEFAQSFVTGGAKVTGVIPKDLRGTFFRNGPGVMEVFGTPLVHPIDGDGLVARLTFHGDGNASFAARFVDTATRREELEAKKMLFHGQMGSRAPGGGDMRFRDPAHTNVFEWGGRLLACHEYTLPHELDPRTLRTLGPTDLGGVLKKTRSLCAHYRYDRLQDRLVTVSFRAAKPALGGKPRPSKLHICEFDRAWRLLHEVYHEIPGYDYCHDLGVTPNYYVVHQTPFVKVDLDAAQRILTGEELPGEQMRLHKELPCRLILLPRRGGAPILVDLPEKCHVYHFGLCFERGGFLEADIVALGEAFTMQFQHRLGLSNADDEPGLLYSVRIDLASMRCVAYRQADRASCEFPVVHPGMHVISEAEPAPRYTYIMGNDGGVGVPYTHVVKVDRRFEGRQSAAFGHCSVGEPCFAPRTGSTAEDDGYVVVQVFDPDRGETSFAVLDARDFSKGPVCRLSLDAYLPNGFHGTWSGDTFLEPASRL